MPRKVTVKEDFYSDKEAVNKLVRTYSRRFAVIFVSVDPERDRTVNLKKFVRSFDEDFDGFVPDKKQLAALQEEFKLVINKNTSFILLLRLP